MPIARWRPLIACLPLVGAGTLAAQSGASVGLGAGTVRAPGTSTLGMVLVTPSLRVTSPQRLFSLGGVFAVLPGGRPYGQGDASTWVASPPVAGGWRVAGDMEVSGATLRDAGSNGTAQAGLELLRSAPRWGVGLGGGGAVGAISGSAPVTAWHGRLRGWWQDAPGRAVLFTEIQPTRFPGGWFTDIAASLTWREGRVTAALSTAARLSEAYGSRGAGTAGIEWRLSRSLTLEGSLGRVLPDPYQGLPASVFAEAGVRLRLPRLGKARREIIHTPRLRIAPGGDGLVIRFRHPGADQVAIAGDWNDWVPQALERVGPGRWKATLRLPAGVYQFRLLIDGLPWSIPKGVPVVDDGFGGRVAVLTVF